MEKGAISSLGDGGLINLLLIFMAIVNKCAVPVPPGGIWHVCLCFVYLGEMNPENTDPTTKIKGGSESLSR